MKLWSGWVLIVLLSVSCSGSDEPVYISSLKGDAESVFLTTNERELPVIAWTERQGGELRFYFATMKGGKVSSFDDAVEVPLPTGVATHAEGMPKVAFASDGSIVAAFETKSPTPGNKYAGAILFTLSRNGGKSWSHATFVHNDTVAGRSRSYFDIERLPDGAIGAAWLDVKLNRQKGGRSVRFARIGEGDRFTSEILVDSSACECCRMDLYTDRSGTINLSYRGHRPGMMGQSIRDMQLVTSRDSGRSFDSPRAISADNWAIDGCPHTGPSLASSSSDLHAFWYTEGRGKGVFYAVKSNGESAFAPRETVSATGQHPQLCVNGDRVLLTWEESLGTGASSVNTVRCQIREGASAQTRDITPEGSDGFFPVAVPSGNGFVVAYLRKEDANARVFVTRMK